MPDIIHLLPDSVANQIAAGEVIQRPASVVKELVENSLDAGATRIQIVVENAGKTLVQVVDNGKGMSATDARLAFERHATSKIRQAEDLFSLHTMGFRGEALPSIAAVAQVVLRTRLKSDEVGTSICIEGSKVTSQDPIACPVGANFSVRNLFFNIPARRKFLKSRQTELSNIVAEVERIALAHPEVSFALQSDSSVLLELPQGNLRQRIVGVFGRKTDSQIVPIEADTTLVRIDGYVGLPSVARRKNAHQFLFANGRFMRHPYFVKAIQTAYERLIPDGCQVPFFIYLSVDPSRIDVNIHPTKTEIKFEDDSAVFQILLAAVREALGKFGAVPTIDFDVENKPDIPSFTAENRYSAPPPQVHINPSFNPFTPSRQASSPMGGHDRKTENSRGEYFAPQSSKVPSGWQGAYATVLQGDHGVQSPEGDALLPHGAAAKIRTMDGSEHPADQSSLYDNLSPADRLEWSLPSGQDFLQFQGRYIVTPLGNGLALVDQHRAHTRILYEQYMRQLQSHQAVSQRLLFPEMITVSPAECVVLDHLLPSLQDVGIEVSSLGTGSYSILTVPVGAEGVSPSQLVQSILADAVAGEANASETIAHIVACALARKVAMPVGQSLSREEMSSLVGQLFTCSTPNMTPNGTPTLVVLSPETFF